MDNLVNVIIPIYRTTLKDWERASLDNTLRLLSAYPILFLIPEGLDIHPLSTVYPSVEVMRVSPDWLGTRRGIAGYNEMMLSRSFYDLFADTEYIFICHLDAWLFRDELAAWCRKGYDLVAAPWPLRPRYRRFPFRQWLALKDFFSRRDLPRSRMFGRIGNGGLCLRRVAAFRQACSTYADEIAAFNARQDDLHNEDIFWALVPREFRYPTNQYLLSVPAGLIDEEDWEKPDALRITAIRELREETGLEVGESDEVKVINPCVFSTPGLTDEGNALMYISINRDEMPALSHRGAEGSEKFEGFRLVSLAEAKDYLRTGRDEHGVYYPLYTWAALMYFVAGEMIYS